MLMVLHPCGHGKNGVDCLECYRLFAADLQKERDAALLQVGEERERCAKIADAFGAKAGNDSAGGMAHVIAQAIRASTEKRDHHCMATMALQAAEEERDAANRQVEAMRKTLEEIANTDRKKLVETFVGFGAACAVAPLINAAQAALKGLPEKRISDNGACGPHGILSCEMCK